MTQLLNVHQINHNQKKAIILMHGYGANAQDLAPIASAVSFSRDFDWYFIEAPISLSESSMMKSFAWFSLEDKMFMGGDLNQYYEEFSKAIPREFSKSLESLVTTYKSISSNYLEIHLGGFSQGSMMALHLYNTLVSTMNENQKLKQLFLFSSVECANVLYQNIKGDVNILQTHGVHDVVLQYDQALKLNHFLKSKFEVEFFSFEGGHEIPMDVLKTWEKFIYKNL